MNDRTLILTIALLAITLNSFGQVLSKLGENVRLGDDPTALPADLRAQAEPHIARNHFKPNVLVATFQEGRYENGAAASGGYSMSKDGGLTWTRALIPNLTRLSGGTHFRTGDSVAAFDLAGHVYLSHIVFTNATPPPTGTVISRSTDEGATFEDPMMVFSNFRETDKSWLAINTFPDSAHPNRLAVVFNIFGDGRDQLRCTFSDDFGQTWSPVQVVGPVRGVYNQAFFLPDGSLAIIYFRYLDSIPDNFSSTSPARIEMILSADGGTTFAPPTLVATLTGQLFHDSVARDAWDTPSACTDRQTGAIYVTYQALIGPTTNRTPRVMFTKSIDKGQTWTAPVPVSNTPNRRSIFNPCIAVSPDGQHVTIAFYDKRHQATASATHTTDYYLAESFDGGDTWEPNVRLSEVSSDLRLAPLTGIGRMFADYQGIVPAVNFDTPGVAVWIDTRTGNPDPWAVRIRRMKGTTFETWQKLRASSAGLDSLKMDLDPDHDGIPNLAEYALGREPNRPDPSPLQIGYDARYFGWNISCERLAVASDIVFSWETSGNLIDWEPWVPVMDDNSVRPASDPSREIVQFSIETKTPVRFYRLKVRPAASSL